MFKVCAYEVGTHVFKSVAEYGLTLQEARAMLETFSLSFPGLYGVIC